MNLSRYFRTRKINSCLWEDYFSWKFESCFLLKKKLQKKSESLKEEYSLAKLRKRRFCVEESWHIRRNHEIRVEKKIDMIRKGIKKGIFFSLLAQKMDLLNCLIYWFFNEIVREFFADSKIILFPKTKIAWIFILFSFSSSFCLLSSCLKLHID